jgi:nicotinate phosphoribosyltransferase
MRFGIPVSGTAAHSWTMSFDDEEESFRALQRSLGDNTVFLLDTYDTIEAAHIVTRLDGTAWGVRLDSGDLVELSKNVRSILDRAGLQKVKIFATNDLDEHRIAELVRAGAPIDAFGVGTQLATSADAPSLSVVYKMVELRRDGGVQYTAKFSDEKSSKPGAKQVFRYESHDVLALQTECISDVGGEPLVRPVLIAGKPVEPRPSITRIQERARKNIEALPRELFDLDGPVPYDVAVSRRLEDLTETVRDRYQATVR